MKENLCVNVQTVFLSYLMRKCLSLRMRQIMSFLVLLLILLLTSVDNVYGAKKVVVFHTKEQIDGTDTTLVNSFVTLRIKGEGSFYNDGYYKVLHDGVLRVETSLGVVSKVEFKCRSKNNGTLNIDKSSSGVISLAPNKKDATWKSSERENAVEFTFSRATYIRSITVTIESDIFILNEKPVSSSVFDGRANVQLFRKFPAKGWSSLVLPFDMSEMQIWEIFGPRVRLANYDGTIRNSDGTYTLNFISSNAIEANIPVLISNVEEKSVYNIPGIDVKYGNPRSEKDIFLFLGSYDNTKLNAGDYFISSNNNFYQARGGEIVPPTRAFFRKVSGKSDAKQILYVTINGNSTGVILFSKEKTSGRTPIFNMSGFCVDEHYTGLVIRNGKKFIQH